MDRATTAPHEVVIRQAEPGDFPAILALNETFVQCTSPLDGAALVDLHAQAAYHRVAEVDGRVVAFLLAVAPGERYESLNYRWFSGRSNDFLYIDRVVVAADHQHAGIGGALYADVAAFAAERGIGRLTCEVNLEPPNPASDAFHARHGFVEVGTQRVAGGAKLVSLREKAVPRAKVARLEDLPYVGPAIAAKLRAIDVNEPADLAGRDPYALFEELSAVTGRRHDPCLLDVFIMLTRFVAGEPRRPWWAYTSERKARLAADRTRP